MPRPRRTGDPDIDQAFAEVAESFDAMRRLAPWLDGMLIKAVTLENGATTAIPHRLGKPYSGWDIKRVYQSSALTTAGTVLEASAKRKDTHLELRTVGFDAPINVDIWVY